MDAVRFVIERRRMFAVTGENPKHSMFNMGTPAEEVVREVEEWATAQDEAKRVPGAVSKCAGVSEHT